ncbi:dipeptide epimerase [Fulvivirgaceae bacterium BMA12]|uniref:Dipeptide epimerase n=1 Tax=Agaribacillus aureus TaxID=3051825 RepID=A0ABT8L947_9BACT|nr:dipeptide epimerase [Fulvivirgaceae bacterium BMA12]
MKIKSIEVWRKNLGNTRPYTIAFKTVDDVDNVFVKLNLENGQYGLGSGNPSEQVVGESLADSMSTLTEENLEFLIGRDIREFHGILDEILTRFPATPAARAALDIAVHDAFTKTIDIPLSIFLGQKIKSMPTSVTIGIKDVTGTLEEAQEYYEMGFRVLKVKTGRDVEEDIERMRKLRERYNGEMTIRVDANQGYDENDLVRFFRETRQLNMELIEQPVPASQVDLMKQLPAEIKALIAADECLKSAEDAFLLSSAPKACDIFNIKLMKSGGIYPARQIATIAKAAGIDLMWGCNDESSISITAALHSALSYRHTKYIDLDGSLDLVVDVVSPGFKIENGWMSITDKPGLGVELI